MLYIFTNVSAAQLLGGVYFQLENFQNLGVSKCEPIEGNNKVNVYT